MGEESSKAKALILSIAYQLAGIVPTHKKTIEKQKQNGGLASKMKHALRQIELKPDKMKDPDKLIRDLFEK